MFTFSITICQGIRGGGGLAEEVRLRQFALYIDTFKFLAIVGLAIACYLQSPRLYVGLTCSEKNKQKKTHVLSRLGDNR